MNATISFNDDYACVYAAGLRLWERDSEKLMFYYGYEHVSPEKEWCFVVKKGSEVIYALSTTELCNRSYDLSEGYEPAKFLIAGMYLYFNNVDDND